MDKPFCNSATYFNQSNPSQIYEVFSFNESFLDLSNSDMKFYDLPLWVSKLISENGCLFNLIDDYHGYKENHHLINSDGEILYIPLPFNFIPVESNFVTSFALKAVATISNRSAKRDTKEERSMKRCVEAFNAMTGHNLSEEDGWYFMQCLKVSRSRSGAYVEDDYLDEVAYALLKAECANNANK